MFCNLKQSPKLYKKNLYFEDGNEWGTSPIQTKVDKHKFVEDDVVHIYKPRYVEINQPIKNDIRYKIVKDGELKSNKQTEIYTEYIIDNKDTKFDHKNLIFVVGIAYILFEVLKSLL